MSIHDSHDSHAARAARSFFSALYCDHVGKDGSIVLWAKGESIPVLWADSVNGAAAQSAARGERLDAYFQPCLHSIELVQAEADRITAGGKYTSRRTEDRRGYHVSATVMPGLWADIDTLDGSHAKTGLPTTTAEVVAMLTDMEAVPTYILDTGGGVHAYWLFDEPWVLETDEDRDAARELNYGWQRGYVLSKLEERGWRDLDSTYDLTRVMRVPGTLNRKYTPPRQVEIVEGGDESNLYTRDQLELFIPESIGSSPNKPKKTIGLKEVPKVDVEPAVISIIKTADAGFESIWNGVKEYPSQSERDLALARKLYRLGMEDEIVLQCLIYNRDMLCTRGTGPPSKSSADKHKGYYEMTMSLAIQGVREDKDAENVDDLVEGMEEKRAVLEAGGQEANNVRADLLARLGKALGLVTGMTIIAIECIAPGGGARRMYTLKTSKGDVVLGEIENITTERKFSAAITDVFRMQPRAQRKAWPKVVSLILELIDDVDLGEDATEEGQTRGMLRAWISNSIPPSGNVEARMGKAIRMGLPYINGEKIYIAPAMAVDKIRRITDTRMTVSNLTKRLRGIGALKESNRMRLPRDENDATRKTVDVWELPFDAPYWREAVI